MDKDAPQAPAPAGDAASAGRAQAPQLLADLGQRLRAARLRRRLSLSQAAQRSGLSRPTLYKVERGAPGVSLDTCLRVLLLYGLADDLCLVAAHDAAGEALQQTRLSRARRVARHKQAMAQGG